MEQAFWVGLSFWVKCPQMINLLALACLSLRAAAASLTSCSEIFRALSTAAGPGRCDLRVCVMVPSSSLTFAICARIKETSRDRLRISTEMDVIPSGHRFSWVPSMGSVNSVWLRELDRWEFKLGFIV